MVLIYAFITLVWTLIASAIFPCPLHYTYPAYARLIKREFPPLELPLIIEEILSRGDEGDEIRCLPKEDAQTLIDVMDEVGHSLLTITRTLTRADFTPSQFLDIGYHGSLAPALQEVPQVIV